MALANVEAQNPELTIDQLRQESDVVDTWFSSWLWPISVFDGIRNPNNEEIDYYYPTNDLVTAPEIMFFWVARMIIAGYEYRGEMPFKNVYYTGIVRDKQGRKMSKSLGNSPDPIDLIGKYGADGVRVGMLMCSPAGNDLPFDESLCGQGKAFSNKIWNAFRLINGWDVADSEQPESTKIAIAWYENKFQDTLATIEDHFSKYRISDALMETYVASLKSCRRKPDVEEILLPGEIELRREAQRRTDGVSIPDETWRQLNELADRLGADLSAFNG